MPLPVPLLRRKKNVYKNQFGHVLILAGSRRMLGAAALAACSAYRTGAGMVTVGVPQSLNLSLHKKIPAEVMTLPLKETAQGTFAVTAFAQLKKEIARYQTVALGPGLTVHSSTVKFVYKCLATFTCPIVIDADALNAVAKKPTCLLKNSGPRILTPHPGEFSRLTHLTKQHIEANRKDTAIAFARKYHCTLLLKGHRTVIADSDGKSMTNRTGNAGMATAGSGDVLTGMIAALLAQGIGAFDSARWAAHLHGRAGDLAIKKSTPASLMAQDIIAAIPQAIKKSI